MTVTQTNRTISELAAQIVAAYVGNHTLPAAKLPDLIGSVHDALSALATRSETRRKPAVPAARSVRQTYVVCLEDGLRFKSMKRHLRTAHGISPEEYRIKWNLPSDHPVVAPAYANQRARIAKRSGLGQTSKRRHSRARKTASGRSGGLRKAA